MKFKKSIRFLSGILALLMFFITYSSIYATATGREKQYELRNMTF